MERFKNYGLWVALASLGGLIVNDLGLLAPEQYQSYVDAVLLVLVAAGIVSNPEKGAGFIDKESK